MGIIQFPTTPNYAGRVLALNIEKTRRFQCHNFWLTSKVPYAVVPPEAQAGMEQIHQAVLDGRLIDVTDASIKGIKTSSFELDKVTEQDTDRMVYFVSTTLKDGSKGVVMVTPKDAEQAADYRRQIAETGTIDLSGMDEKELEHPTGLSKIEITPIQEKT